ncbi:hypothetical protein GIB67_026212 [Kingdonia uniflora]|uniref:MICOS complex subunit MIC10 n=1 Tax=Kingdonia uniflora TaxID=39325 RepID=A0A7J7LA06_9MAGN|nr:hypothetical protein GIB67_026212 [Kingdonia uniflora]
MAENKQIPPECDVNAKWDACIDLTVRRVVYSSLAGTLSGLLLFRSPVTRWASVALGAGIGIGSAYSDCSRLFEGSSTKWTPPKVAPTSQVIWLRLLTGGWIQLSVIKLTMKSVGDGKIQSVSLVDNMHGFGKDVKNSGRTHDIEVPRGTHIKMDESVMVSSLVASRLTRK